MNSRELEFPAGASNTEADSWLQGQRPPTNFLGMIPRNTTTHTRTPDKHFSCARRRRPISQDLEAYEQDTVWHTRTCSPPLERPSRLPLHLSICTTASCLSQPKSASSDSYASSLSLLSLNDTNAENSIPLWPSSITCRRFRAPDDFRDLCLPLLLGFDKVL